MTALTPLRDCPERLDSAAQWFHEKWGIPLSAYRESMARCLRAPDGIPQWYLCTDGARIVAGLGVIENDFHERRDLTPNVCAVYVEAAYRRRGVARRMLDFVCADLATLGYPVLYLLTDHTEFYEACGWEFFCTAAETGGGEARLYRHTEPAQHL